MFGRVTLNQLVTNYLRSLLASHQVPNAATAPILILVGAMMIGESQHIDWADMSQAIPAFLTSMMMPFTFSIPNGILFGVGMSAIFFITTGEFLKYLKPARRSALRALGGGPGRDGGLPNEATSLQGGGNFPERGQSLFDDTQLTR